MANTITDIMPKILARSLMVLRERTVMPRLVNADYSSEAAQKGATIDVPYSQTKEATDVVPSHNDPAPTDSEQKTVQIPLNEWKKTDFHLTDKEMNQIDMNAHFIPTETQEAINGLARNVNGFIMGQYKGVYGYYGTAGTTPFGSSGDAAGVAGATQSRKVLNEQLAPLDFRAGVLDFAAEASALALSPFSDAEKIGSNGVKIEGEIGRKYGVQWTSDDQVPMHIAGTLTGAPAVTGANIVGTKAIGVSTGASEAINLVEGDIVTFAGDSQTYVVTADLNVGASASGTLNIEPGLKVATTGSEAIAVKGDHVVNLVFHRDAFAFAQRPLVTEDEGFGSRIMTMTDPQTGISLRLEVKRQYKQTTWEFDLLYGAKLVQPPLAMRLAG